MEVVDPGEVRDARRRARSRRGAGGRPCTGPPPRRLEAKSASSRSCVTSRASSDATSRLELWIGERSSLQVAEVGAVVGAAVKGTKRRKNRPAPAARSSRREVPGRLVASSRAWPGESGRDRVRLPAAIEEDARLEVEVVSPAGLLIPRGAEGLQELEGAAQHRLGLVRAEEAVACERGHGPGHRRRVGLGLDAEHGAEIERRALDRLDQQAATKGGPLQRPRRRGGSSSGPRMDRCPRHPRSSPHRASRRANSMASRESSRA